VSELLSVKVLEDVCMVDRHMFVVIVVIVVGMLSNRRMSKKGRWLLMFREIMGGVYDRGSNADDGVVNEEGQMMIRCMETSHKEKKNGRDGLN